MEKFFKKIFFKALPSKNLKFAGFQIFGGRTTDVNTLPAGAFPAPAVSQYRFMSNFVEKKESHE